MMNPIPRTIPRTLILITSLTQAPMNQVPMTQVPMTRVPMTQAPMTQVPTILPMAVKSTP